MGMGMILAAVLVPFVTPYMILATLSYFVMLAGVSVRKISPKVHTGCMAIAMLGDLGLALVLEIERGATETALSFTLGPLQQLHILHSTIAMLLYVPIAWLGFRNLKSGTSNLWHKRLGLAAVYFRTGGFLLMFSMLKR